MLLAPAPDFGDPLGLLGACHRRVERFLRVLRHVAGGLPELDPEASEALRQALRYFAEAAPLHTRDEEDSLAPRLLPLLGQESGLREGWERLEAEHRAKGPLLEALARHGSRSLEGPVGRDEARAFRACVAELEALYTPHIAYEDDQLFPAAARLLSPADLREIGQEMAARRSSSRAG